MARKTVKANVQEQSPGKGMDCASEQDAKIAELAYLKAERRGFKPSNELEDWLDAEQEVFFTKSNHIPVVTGNFDFQVEA